MKLPMPPTGGQGGHYSHGSQGRTRIFGGRGRAPAEREPVPKRFRKLRLRKRKRSRVSREHPLMFAFVLLVLGVLAIPLMWFAWGIFEHLIRALLT